MFDQLNKAKSSVQSRFSSDYTLAGIKLMIIAWCFFIIVITLIIDNKVLLGAILAYEVLP